MSQLSNTTINNHVYLYDSVTATKQNNVITIPAGSRYVSADIQIDIKVTKAVLTTQTGENTFDIQVPNGKVNNVQQYITFHFQVDSNGNTTVTQGTVT